MKLPVIMADWKSATIIAQTFICCVLQESKMDALFS